MEENKNIAPQTDETAAYNKIISDCFTELRDKALAHTPTVDLLRLRAAFDYAEEAHRPRSVRTAAPI